MMLPDWLSFHLERLRPGSPPAGVSWDTPLTAAPYFLDSLELVTLAGQAADSFQMRTAGLEDYLLARRTLNDWKELILESWSRSDQPALQFATSGTTGPPAYHTHLLSHLEEEVEFFRGLLDPPPLRILSTVPTQHIYGFLFGALLPAALEIPGLRVSPEAPRWKSGDLVIAHPLPLTLWRRRNLDLPKDIRIITSTGALEQEEWAWLRENRVFTMEIYGSSETAGVGFRSAPASPYTLLPWWSPLKEGDQLNLMRSGLSQAPALPDLLEWEEPRKFLPRGRKDRAVKIGGRLVSTEAVTRTLNNHPQVSQVRLKVIDTPMGPRFQALVVPEGTLSETALREWAAQHLESAARPASYLFMDRLPEKNPGQIS